MIKNIPYYDFSTFPVNNNIILKIIDSAVISGFKMIFINFGGSFPWSMDNILLSEYSYPEKVIEKIVNICRQHEIILVPVLSIMINSDFILRTKKYNYLIDDDKKINGLDPSAAGAEKFIEELIDDIFNILTNSEYLLIELPRVEFVAGDTVNNITVIIKRLSEALEINHKKLIVGSNQPSVSIGIKEICNEVPVIFKIFEEQIEIYNGNSYQLNLKTERVVIKEIDYRLFILNGTEGFIADFDSGYLAINYHVKPADLIIRNIELETIDIYFHNLDIAWLWIRKSRENLSLLYRNTDLIYRTGFLRSFSNLRGIYTTLKETSAVIIKSLEKTYQPGVLRQWVDSKLDSIDIQFNELEVITKQIGE